MLVLLLFVAALVPPFGPLHPVPARAPRLVHAPRLQFWPQQRRLRSVVESTNRDKTFDQGFSDSLSTIRNVATNFAGNNSRLAEENTRLIDENSRLATELAQMADEMAALQKKIGDAEAKSSRAEELIDEADDRVRKASEVMRRVSKLITTITAQQTVN
eukprot:scaffold233497_cov37-Tisochrysis_lutea.AAC.1